MKSVDVIRSRVKGRTSCRLRNVEYSVMHGNISCTVCALAFCNIHRVSDRRLCDKVSGTGSIKRDQRGHQENSRKMHESVKQKMIQHIKSFSALSSHYTAEKKVQTENIYLQI